MNKNELLKQCVAFVNFNNIKEGGKGDGEKRVWRAIFKYFPALGKGQCWPPPAGCGKYIANSPSLHLAF